MLETYLLYTEKNVVAFISTGHTSEQSDDHREK